MDSFVEYLHELKDLKKQVDIRFRFNDGGLSTTHGHIVKMDEVSDRWMVETDSGLVIGVDQIVDVNGKPAENIC